MPSLFVLVVYCTRVTSLTATTSASVTAALVESETRPLIFPLGDWANKELVITAKDTKTQTNRAKRIAALQGTTEYLPLSVKFRGKSAVSTTRLHFYFRTEGMKRMAGLPDNWR